MSSPRSIQAPELQVSAGRDVAPATVEHARARILDLLATVREPVLSARVRLTRMHNPSVERPALAQATVDVDGRLARAHVAAPTMGEAIGLLRDRLAVQLSRLHRDREARRGRGGAARPHEWRRGDEGLHRPHYVPLPREDRRIVRRKSYPLALESAGEAALELETMDFDFHLFTEIGTREDSVIHRFGAGPYRLAQVHPRPEALAPSDLPMTVLTAPATRMTEEQAVDRLEATGGPFVVYADASTGRGNLLYYRYDGHYGLISPASDRPSAHREPQQ
ncbi:HPF/RaiA family ribosome-associated protein [Kitasatospora paranensis]|uniref:HPF/RaiA family ribosome-associated protein n=1 Tax=Kitasatospora paranensis TaxID=258053 RepID=A0ABW2FVK6_9ACTN